MKKLLVVGALCAISALGAYAQYTAWCGEVVETVNEEDFDDATEAKAFFRDLDIIYCGGPNPNEQP